jgi:hypothetical protein
MNRSVVATPLFARRLQEFVDHYAELGALRFLERMEAGYRNLVDNIATFENIAPARRRRIGGKTITVREYVLDAGARDFLILYWVPPDPDEPAVLLNIRIGGQHRFRWAEGEG